MNKPYCVSATVCTAQSRGAGRIGFADCMTPSVDVVPSVQVVTAVLETLLLFRSLLPRAGLACEMLNKEEDALCFSERTLVAPYCRSVSGPTGPKRLGPVGPTLSIEVCVQMLCRKSNFRPKGTLFSIGGMFEFIALYLYTFMLRLCRS